MEDQCISVIALFTFEPDSPNWVKCDGRAIKIADNVALFSLISTSYGGDGRMMFELPNLINKSPVPGMEYYICVEGLFPSQS